MSNWNVVLDPPGAMLPGDSQLIGLLGGLALAIGSGSSFSSILIDFATAAPLPAGTPLILYTTYDTFGQITQAQYMLVKTGAYQAAAISLIHLDKTYVANANYGTFPTFSAGLKYAIRAPLDLNNGSILVDQKGIDWGDSAVTPYEADFKVGSASVSSRAPNRIVHIPLLLGGDGLSQEETVRSQLQEKVGLIQAEGGCVLRQRGSGQAMYADIVSATLTLPDVYGETGDVEPDVVLTLECLPDFYGDEIALDNISTVSYEIDAVLMQGGEVAVIQGDSDARVRIQLTSHLLDHQALVWGVRSRFYDPSSLAALFYEAETMTPVGAAAIAFLAGASPDGSTSANVITSGDLVPGSWVPVLLTDTVAFSQALIHRGSYQVLARVYSPSNPLTLQFLWGVGDIANPVVNDPVTLPIAQALTLVDLGQIKIEASPVGQHSWKGLIQVMGTDSTDTISIDCLFFVPLDEYSGQLRAYPPSPQLGVVTQEFATAVNNNAAVGTVAWTSLSIIPGGFNSFIVATTGPADTEYLELTDFGFAIPSGATISGIKMEIDRFGDPFAGIVADNIVKLVKAGTVAGSSEASPTSWPLGFSLATYGGQTDLWGTTWTAAQINDPGTGVVISVALASSGSQAVVRGARMTVYYTLSGAFTPVTDATTFHNQSIELRTDGMFRATTNGLAVSPVSMVVGDLPRLPCSGLEQRPVEILLKPSYFTPGSDPNTDLTYILDYGDPELSAQVFYRPVWLGRP